MHKEQSLFRKNILEVLLEVRIMGLIINQK